MVAARPTGEKRPHARIARDRENEIGFTGRVRSAHAVGSEAANRSAFRVFFGAIVLQCWCNKLCCPTSNQVQEIL